MAIDLTETRNWVYVICTAIQTLLAIIGLFFVSYLWERQKRKEDRKEARQKDNEDRQKAETEKIVAILSENYDEVQNIFRTLKKDVDNLKKKKIDTGSYTFTEFDILLYMCHGDNWHKFEESYQPLPYQRSIRSDCGREQLMDYVHKIMKFFKNFSFHLSCIDKSCPNNIKSEFSNEIIEMGITIHPFMTKTRQKLIGKVLKYFGYTDVPNILNNESEQIYDENMQCCFSCCRKQLRSRSPITGKTQRPESQRFTSDSTPHVINFEMKRLSSANKREGPTLYPGHDEIKRAIPYIEYFRYHNGEITCNLECQYSCLEDLYISVQEKNIVNAMKETMSKEIKSLWLESCGSNLSGDLLHLIRMMMFKLSEDSKFFQSNLLHDFLDYVKKAVSINIDIAVSEFSCERSLQAMEKYIRNIRHASSIKHLLQDKRTKIFLEHHAEEFRKFIMMMLDDTQQVETHRRFSS